MMVRGKGACSKGSTIEKVWRTIWKIKGPRVVHLFLWKACQNLLPTKANLYRRHINSNPLCPICGMEEETLGHILWSCPLAKDVWAYDSKKLQKMICEEEEEFFLIFKRIMEELIEGEAQLLAVVARQIWL
jgi:hypothetical protein